MRMVRRDLHGAFAHWGSVADGARQLQRSAGRFRSPALAAAGPNNWQSRNDRRLRALTLALQRAGLGPPWQGGKAAL